MMNTTGALAAVAALFVGSIGGAVATSGGASADDLAAAKAEVSALADERDALLAAVQSADAARRDAVSGKTEAVEAREDDRTRAEEAEAERDEIVAKYHALLDRVQADRQSQPSPTTSPSSSTTTPAAKRASAGAAGTWLTVRDLKDGDSWVASNGVEYRLYAANAPDKGECYAAEATARTKHLLSSGFTVRVVDIDRYGREVAVVTLRDNSSLAVNLGETGHADNRYTATFRSASPADADAFSAAYDRAKTKGRGLHSACGPSTSAGSSGSSATSNSAASSSSSCHWNYDPCIPIKGDGSGNGSANDLDCGDIRKRVRIKGADPYRLDGRDNDGWGCESYG